jgi:hypothetical protein
VIEPYFSNLANVLDHLAKARRFGASGHEDPDALKQAATVIRQLATDLDAWRTWAQFVFLGGGPVTSTDTELRDLICRAIDGRSYTRVVHGVGAISTHPDGMLKRDEGS